jgi:hypothetical protein
LNQALRIKRAVEKARREFMAQTERHINTILSNYELALNDITRELSNIDTAIDSFSTQRLTALQSFITQRITQIKNVRDGQVINALNDAGKSGFDTQMLQRAIMGKAVLDIPWDFFLPRGVEQYQSFALQLCDQYDQELVNAIQQRLRMGFIERKSWSEMITDIRRNAFGFKKYQRVDRKDKGASWKIKRMVRTETQRMRTMAEEEVIKQDPDIIGVYYYFGGGECPNNECPRLVGEYYKDGSGNGWPPPSIPIHPNSYSKDTEIYTERGFIPVGEVKVDEKVLSLNPETFDLEWIPVIETFQHKEEKMVHFYSRNFDLLVTLDHNVFCKRRERKHTYKRDWEFIKAIDVPSETSFYRSSNWKGKEQDFIEINGLQIQSELFAAFMGWYLSEGSVSGRNRVIVAQSKKIHPQNYEQIREILNQLPGIEGLYLTGNGIEIRNEKLNNWLSQFGHCNEKYVPQEVKELPPDKIKVFLNAYANGDGHIRESKSFKGGNFREEIIHTTSSKRMADDLGELILKIGKRPSYCLLKNKGKEVQHRNGKYIGNYDIWMIKMCYAQISQICATGIKKEIIDYNDITYCVQLPKNHTVWVRRNGKTTWSGNCKCYTSNIYPEIKDYISSLREK